MYKSEGRDGSGSNNNGSDPVEHRCMLCGMVFTSTNALGDHFRAAHQDSMEVVENKNEISLTLGRKRKSSSFGDLERHGLACPPQSRESLDAHQPSVIQENSVPPSSVPNKCCFCNRKFATYRGLRSHMYRYRCRRIHKPVPPSSSANSSVQHKCRFCNREFATSRGLGNHMNSCRRIHEPVPPSSSANSSVQNNCRFCNREFATYLDLGIHMNRCGRIHEPVPPSSSANSSVQFKCDFCNEELSTAYYLRAHKMLCPDNPVPPPFTSSDIQHSWDFNNTESLTSVTLGNREESWGRLYQPSQLPFIQYDPVPPSSSPNLSVQHRCNSCNAVFSTSQALRNHQVSCRHIYQLAQSSVGNRYEPVLPPSTNSFVQHRCAFCNTVFSTFQALRNHEASGICMYQPAQPSVVNRYDPVPPSSSLNLSVQHRCGFCNMVFSTDQAVLNHEASGICIYQPAQPSVDPVPTSSSPNLSVQHRCYFCNTVFSTAQAVLNHEVSCRRIYQLAQPSVLPQPSQAAPSTLPSSSAYSSGEGQATGGSQQEAQVKTQLHLNRTQPSP